MLNNFILLFWRQHNSNVNAGCCLVTWRKRLQNVVLMPLSLRETPTCIFEPIQSGNSFVLNKWPVTASERAGTATADIIINQWSGRTVEAGRRVSPMRRLSPGSGCEDVFHLGELARKLARIRGSGVSCFTWKWSWWWAKMAADAKPVATLFENKGAGLELHHSWSGGFPPLSCFCREQLCRDSQGDLSCFLTVPPSILDLTLFKNYTQNRLQPTGFEHQRSSNMPLLFRINCFYRKFSPEYPPSFCHPRRI